MKSGEFLHRMAWSNIYLFYLCFVYKYLYRLFVFCLWLKWRLKYHIKLMFWSFETTLKRFFKATINARRAGLSGVVNRYFVVIGLFFVCVAVVVFFWWCCCCCSCCRCLRFSSDLFFVDSLRSPCFRCRLWCCCFLLSLLEGSAEELNRRVQ